MIKLKACLLFLCILGMQLNATAQTIDLFAETPTTVAKDIATGIFKTTRIVNGQSIENVGEGILDFRILHRFGAINQGGYEFFGLDQATMRMGLMGVQIAHAITDAKIICVDLDEQKLATATGVVFLYPPSIASFEILFNR